MRQIPFLSHKSPDSHFNVKIEFGEGDGKVPLDAIAEQAGANAFTMSPKKNYFACRRGNFLRYTVSIRRGNEIWFGFF